MKLRSNKGFSLVELIIVIAILGIIALIAVPNLTGIQQRSQVNADIRTAEQIGKAVRIWRVENPSATAINSTTWTKLATLTTLSSYISLEYVPNSKVDDSTNVKETGAYYVKFSTNVAGQEKVMVAIGADDTVPDASLDDEYTDGKTGVAYVEGVSDLSEYLESLS